MWGNATAICDEVQIYVGTQQMNSLRLLAYKKEGPAI